MAKGKFDMSEFLAPVEGVPESDTTREIAVDDILDNPLNFYPRPDNGKLAELMESIQANGLLEPPTVVPAGEGKYRLISGHSRMNAVRLLSAHKDTAVAERFQRVLCRVLPSMTTEQEECAVIEANRQRVKSPALLAEEAERLTKIYIKRREAGEELPGRIRDRVAEAMQVNKTKLANLSAIKRGLKVPGIVRKWEAGDIPEAAALEIARMDDNTQYRLLDWVIDNRRSYTIKDVQEFVKSREAGVQASEDEKYIELLTYMRDSLEQTLRDCADRQSGILALKTRFRWAAAGRARVDLMGPLRGWSYTARMESAFCVRGQPCGICSPPCGCRTAHRQAAKRQRQPLSKGVAKVKRRFRSCGMSRALNRRRARTSFLSTKTE